jgi:hypothetical protein
MQVMAERGVEISWIELLLKQPTPAMASEWDGGHHGADA